MNKLEPIYPWKPILYFNEKTFSKIDALNVCCALKKGWGIAMIDEKEADDLIKKNNGGHFLE